MPRRMFLAMLLVGIAASTLSIAYFSGALSALIGNNHHTTTTTPASQPPSLSALYTGSEQVPQTCNSYFPCPYNHTCYPGYGAPCENNFTITNKGNQSVILSGYGLPDGQTGFLWQPIGAGAIITLSIWDPAGYESSSITLTTSEGFTVTLGTLPPQSISFHEGHGFQDNYHVSLALQVLSNSSMPSRVNFTSYSIQDSQGYTYTNSSFARTIMPYPPSVYGYLPGASSMILSYAPGFAHGSNYTIALITSAYGSFRFQVTGGMFQGLITESIQNLIAMNGMNASGFMISMHFTVLSSSVGFYQALVYDLNNVIGTYTCPTGGTSCTFSGSTWITVTLTTAVSTVPTYWIALSFSGDAPGYYVTF